MATKNLARTVIEGGRCGHYKTAVADEASRERTAQRGYLRAVACDPEAAEEVAEPLRRNVSPCFADKTRPLRRFLDSRVGKPWAATYSLIRERFDVRATPGRHVVKDHLLADVDRSGNVTALSPYSYIYRGAYYVDAGGLLRKRPRTRFDRYVRPDPGPSVAAIAEWLGNRKVGRMGARWVWHEPARDGRFVRAVPNPEPSVCEPILYIGLDAFGRPAPSPSGGSLPACYRNGWRSPPYRQGRPLNAEEERFWLSVDEGVRSTFTVPSRVRAKVFR